MAKKYGCDLRSLDRGQIQARLHRVLAVVVGGSRTPEQLAEDLICSDCRGYRNLPDACPLKIAISREFGDQVEVWGKAVYYDDVGVPLPRHAVDFINEFDTGGFDFLSRSWSMRDYRRDYLEWYYSTMR